MGAAVLGIGPDREHLEIVGQVAPLECNDAQQSLGCGELGNDRIESS